MTAALRTEDDIEVVAEARDEKQAVFEAKRSRPDLVLLGTDLPDCNGLDSVSQIKQEVPECRVLVLSSQEDQRLLLTAIEAGAHGYLTKESPLTDLIDAVRSVHSGETLVPPSMLGSLLSTLIRKRRDEDDMLKLISALTRREREVLALLADGADNEVIGDALGISPQTARTHIQNILAKLNVHSRLEAATLVIQNGILDELVGAR